MEVIVFVLLICAAACALLAAFNVAARLSLGWLGFLFYVVAVIIEYADKGRLLL